VRDAGGQQPDGRKFFALLELIFKTQAFSCLRKRPE
jgi:hypothetical protein